jgi:7-carboxy-7-deazaguanine synthase
VSKLKISELFYSIQGEGYHAGVPSIFLRTFGCNFTCSGFGMPRGEKSTERDNIDAANIKTYKELPLVSTGCDSYASWDPRFKHLSPMLTVEAIVDRMQKLLPNGVFGQEVHLVITGGEPLLGWQKQYPDLFAEIQKREMFLEEVTFETNGTQPLSPEFTEYLFRTNLRITFSISPKLSISGEKREDAIRPNVVSSYEDVDANWCNISYLKFVVGNAADVEEVDEVVDLYRQAGFGGYVYLMPVGGVANEQFFMTEKDVALLAMKKGYRFSPRLQVNLFKNEWGT